MPPDRYEPEVLPRILAGLDLLRAEGTRIDDDLFVFVRAAMRTQRPLFTREVRAGHFTLSEPQVRTVEAALWRGSLDALASEAPALVLR